MPTTWQAPDAGTWHLDDSHVQGAMTPFYAQLFPSSAEEGLNVGFRRWGLPLAIDFAVVEGRLYYRVTPPDPGELAHRERCAAETILTKRWRADRHGWEGELNRRFRSDNLELQRVEPSELDDGSLRDHLRAVVDAFQAGNRQHFDQFLASTFPVGEFIARASEWTGGSVAEMVAALQGASPASASSRPALDDVAMALADDPDATTLAQDRRLAAGERLSRLRSSSGRLQAALHGYLEEHGQRVVTGFDLSDRTALELPEVLLESITACRHAADRARPVSPGDVAARLRSRVPTAARPGFDEALAEARAAYGLHDADLGVTHLWPLGLLRRALLACGRRLRDRGAVEQPEHVFEATPDEVEALLGGSGIIPSSDDLTRRAKERRLLSSEEAPLELGPEEEPLPLDQWPPQCARLASGFLSYLEAMEPGPAQVEQPATSLTGLPASPGRYQGHARIVRGPEDFGRLAQGDVLVARVTSPAYSVVLPLVGAVVTDKGGCLCHAAIVAREFGIPAVVGTRVATSGIPEAALVLVDGVTGVVEILTGSGRDGEEAPGFGNPFESVDTEVGERDAGAGHQILHGG